MEKLGLKLSKGSEKPYYSIWFLVDTLGKIYFTLYLPDDYVPHMPDFFSIAIKKAIEEGSKERLAMIKESFQTVLGLDI